MFTSNSKPSLPDLSGKVVIVTGGNNGIGKTTTLNLLKQGAKVYIACRDPAKAQESIGGFKLAVPSCQVEVIRLNLASLASVKAAAEEFIAKEKELHILINNAGIMGLPYSLSEDGYEVQWATNYMGHYLLTKLLIPTLLATTGEVRVVNLTSSSHENVSGAGIVFDNVNLPDSGAMERYGKSKLANILHTKSLVKLYGDKIIFTAVHPGAVRTNLSDNFLGSYHIPSGLLTLLSPFILTVEKGSWGTLYAAASPEVKREDNGVYFTGVGKRTEPSVYAKDEGLAERLWEWTESELKKKGY